MTNTSDCASPDRPVVTATVTDAGCHPREVTVTICGVDHVVDVSCDRDDWRLPEVDDAALEIRVLVAVDDAVDGWDDGAEVSARARQRARMDGQIWDRR